MSPVQVGTVSRKYREKTHFSFRIYLKIIPI